MYIINLYCVFSTCSTDNYTIAVDDPGTPIAGQVNYTLTCTVGVGEGMPTLQWMGPDGSEVTTGGEIIVGNPDVNGSVATLSLTFSRLVTSHGGEYTCQSTVGTRAVERTVTATISVQS